VVSCDISPIHSSAGASISASSSVGTSADQCLTGVTSSTPVIGVVAFAPISASVGNGSGTSSSIANVSPHLAMAKIEEILQGLWKASAFAVS